MGFMEFMANVQQKNRGVNRVNGISTKRMGLMIFSPPLKTIPSYDETNVKIAWGSTSSPMGR